MPQFLKKTGCKVLGAILCILLLAAGLFFGILTLVVAGYGGFTSQSTLYDGLVADRLYQDTNAIMNDYFDPSDPSHPWVSYYSGSIFTGDNSNMLWTITAQGSDTPVLSTYDGEDSMMDLSSDFSYTVTESSPGMSTPSIPSCFTATASSIPTATATISFLLSTPLPPRKSLALIPIRTPC